MSNILGAILEEINNPLASKLLSQMAEWECNEILSEFDSYKKQVMGGALEANINYGFLKEIERPIKTLIDPNGLTACSLLFPSIMNTLQALYKKSSIYQESRLISLLEKIVSSILRNVEYQVNIKTIFGLLTQSSGNAKKVSMRISLAKMVIETISKSLFIRSWLDNRKTLSGTKDSSKRVEDQDLEYLAFSRPTTAYIHDFNENPSKNAYVPITNKNLPQHLRMQERKAVIGLPEKKMWFERAEMLLNTMVYAKNALTNIEAMCNSYTLICNSMNTLDTKSKLYNETVDFLKMYTTHEIPYAVFEIQSAEAFESFVVF